MTEDDKKAEANAMAAAEAGAQAGAEGAGVGHNGEGYDRGSEVEQLRAEIEEARTKARENYETMLRTAADFDNYRKRMARDSLRDRELAEEKILKKLLPVVDNFERGLEHMRTATRIEPLKEGTEATYRQLTGLLQELGVTQMEALDRPFDPKLHDAISQAVAPDKPDGTVVAVAEPGYLIKDRVLRHAKVVVSKQP